MKGMNIEKSNRVWVSFLAVIAEEASSRLLLSFVQSYSMSLVLCPGFAMTTYQLVPEQHLKQHVDSAKTKLASIRRRRR